MNKSESIQLGLLTLIVTLTLYLTTGYCRNLLFPNTGLLTQLVCKDLDALAKSTDELNRIADINIEGAQGDALAQGWALFIKDSIPKNANGNLSADVLVISQYEDLDGPQAIVQITLQDANGNFVSELARTYNLNN